MSSDESELDQKRRAALEGMLDRARAMADTPDGDVHVVELLSIYVKHEPEDGLAWFHLGDALRTVGRFREAEDALLKAADRAPKSYLFTIYARIGMLMEKRGCSSDAEKWYRAATSEPGCPGWMWTLRGANLLRMEMYELARRCLETALASTDVVKEEVLLNLALMARAQAKYDDARRFARDALGLDPALDGAKRILDSLENIEKTIESAASVR